MRVLHIIGTLNPESGGPASSVATLNKFRAQGSVNEAVTLDDPAAIFLRGLDFTVTALGPTTTKYGWNPRLLPWLRANAERFDGVVVHGLWQYCGLAAWRAFAGHRPYMVFAHGMLDPYFKHAFPLKHLKKALYWLLIENWVLRGAYRVLFASAEEAHLARQSFSPNSWTSHIVSLGTSLPPGPETARKLAFLARLPYLNDRRFLLFLGRIDRKKGCDLLIAAFLRAAAQNPGLDLDLVIAGPDPNHWRADLSRTIARAGLSDRVHWTGMLEGDEKWGAFIAAEAFILPSHQENFGIAVAEAMACGRAVLLSNKVNIAPEITAAGAGLMEPDTLDGTYRLISRWIAMGTDERRRMEDAALQLFADRYDMRKNARDVGGLLYEATHAQLTEMPASVSAVK